MTLCSWACLFFQQSEMNISPAAIAKSKLKRLQRGVIAAARAIHNALVSSGRPFGSALITLTYRPDVEWQPSHIRDLLRHYRAWAKRKGFKFRYVWVLELQQNGKPHYHIVTWFPAGITGPMPDKQGWWPHGMSNCKWATSPVGYIAKYASKGTDGVLPKGARTWGHGGLDIEGKAELAFSLAPKWLKKAMPGIFMPKKAKREILEVGKNGDLKPVTVGGWLCRFTNYFFLSPFDFDGWTPQGIKLYHRGYIEMFTPEGDAFRIPHVLEEVIA